MTEFEAGVFGATRTLTLPALLAPGDRFADFVVRRRLGRGGSSEVYLVDDPDGRAVALKILGLESVRTELAQERFRHEFDIARNLRHPNIVAMFSHGSEEGRLWMTMQYVNGSAASTLVPGQHEIPDLARLLDVLRRIAAGLDYAHGENVLHGDVKPSNMLVGRDDPALVVLTDFGIARALDEPAPSHARRILGSIPYAAPEVLTAQQLYPSTDQYGLACSIVEFLTGRTPFPRSNKFAIAYAHRSTPPPQLSRRRSWIPRAVDTIVGTALAKDPLARYASCGELVKALTDALPDAQPTPPPRSIRRRLRRML
ncbi:serine/threonine-protein kinase [Antrihabitans sp. YC2-6]|uniref:serine/threonine-protein kinase n=1 Tax=Antrihabitans sp. YC2-6 TaxID=2799498 RepID=UPI0018F4E34A|nr:serine/threonine-protein kinase [Antrihabitans sp. YC2-6]MBJ8348774.1 serine/threonine protein kinase [Antrihabitans sp. YC2-6]